MTEPSALAAKLCRTAASVAIRGGRPVPLHYESAAGELAMCMRGVGLVDREDLGTIELRGEPAALELVLAEQTGTALSAGQATSIGGVYWGRTTAETAVVASADAADLAVLAEQPRRLLEPSGGAVRANGLVALALIGPATPGLLLELGAYGSLSGDGRGLASKVAGTTWMLFDDTHALALVEPELALATWDAVSLAGRTFGLGYVGLEAAQRFELTRCVAGRDRVPL